MLSDKAQKVVVVAVAKAIRGTQKFRKAEYDSVAAEITKAVMTDNSLVSEMGEMLGKIGNISQTSQDLAKAGLVAHGEPSAFARQISDALDMIGEAEKKAAAEMNKK